MIRDSVLVAVRPDSCEISSEGLITGKICFQIGERYFPEHDWNDFVMILLTSWGKALAELLDAKRTSSEFRFMDGPFLARVSATDHCSLRWIFVDARDGEKHLFSVESAMKDFATSFLKASECISQRALSDRWLSSDLNALRDSIQLLKRSVANNENMNPATNPEDK